MFDRRGIYQRFADCHEAESPVQLAKIIGIDHASVFRWRKGEKPIPWKWLQRIVDSRGVSWDWLIEGKGPKELPGYVIGSKEDFDWEGINERFLGLFPNKTQIEIATELNVSQATVSKWERSEEHVPWGKLKDAINTYNVTLNWLIEGSNK